VEALLERFARAGRILVATRSSNPRALDALELAERARPYFDRVETAEPPEAALELARTLGDRVLATGSLYLLSDLSSSEAKTYDGQAW
jgi:folylpolyglutamate synthase/dihydropteroate synthase